MTTPAEPLEVHDNIVVKMPDGLLYRIRPGPYGKGVSITPIIPKGGPRPSPPPLGRSPRGRKPRASTVALRKRLVSDVQKGDVAEATAYVDWLMARDSEVGLAVARQVVYRERRRALEGML